MPKIAVYKNLVFFIVSYDLRERFHLHVVNTRSKRSYAAKVWFEPVEVFDKGDLTSAEINLVISLVNRNKKELISKIRNFAEGKKSKPLLLKFK